MELIIGPKFPPVHLSVADVLPLRGILAVLAIVLVIPAVPYIIILNPVIVTTLAFPRVLLLNASQNPGVGYYEDIFSNRCYVNVHVFLRNGANTLISPES